MGGGFPSGELMLVAQKSQTGSGLDIFSWMNVMLTLSKGFVKRNMLTTTTKDYVYLLLGIFQIRGKSTGKDMFIFKLTEAPNRNVHCPNVEILAPQRQITNQESRDSFTHLRN